MSIPEPDDPKTTPAPVTAEEVSPYASPLASEPVVEAGVMSFGTKFAIVLCLVLGGLGLMAAVMGLTGLLINNQFTGFGQMGTAPNAPPEMAEAAADMQGEMEAIMRQYLVWNLVANLAHLVIAGFLMAGSIQALRMRPGAFRMLRQTCLAAIAFEMARCVLTVLQQMEMMDVMADFMTRMAEAGSGQGGPDGEMMGAIMRIGSVVGVVLAISWVVVKIAIYLWTIIATRRQPQLGSVGAAQRGESG